MSLMESLIPKVRAAGRTVVLPEGNDPRVIRAAVPLQREGRARPGVLATPA